MDCILLWFAIPWVFWTLLILEGIFFIWATEDDNAFLATIFGACLLADYAGGFKALWHSIIGNPIVLLYGAVIYLAVGLGWSICKWYFYNRKIADKYYAFKKEWMLSAHVDDICEDNVEAFARCCSREFHPSTEQFLISGAKALQPSVRGNKHRIVMWIAYWPASSLWTLLNDPFRKAAEYLFERVKSIFEGISNNIFKV